MNPIFYLETGEGSSFGGNEYTSEAAQRLLEEAANISEHRMCGVDIPQVDSIVPDL